MGAIVQLEVERSVLAAKEVDFWRDKRGRCGWADRGEEVEEVDHVKTVSEVAAEANISDLYDPRVLGKCVERYVKRTCTSTVVSC